MAEPRHIRFLASVRDENEARLALAGGAEIIDCKEPLSGALGALPLDVVSGIRRAVPAHVPVSATVGDLPCEAGILCDAASAMASTGVDYVKIGIFPGGNPAEAVSALGKLDLGDARLVAVLFADAPFDPAILNVLSAADFAGVLLDTARKDGGALIEHLSKFRLRAFVDAARERSLFAGLAGSLRMEHIATMCSLEPDIVGFRGALCAGSRRVGTLDLAAVRAVARELTKVQPAAEALAS